MGKKNKETIPELISSSNQATSSVVKKKKTKKLFIIIGIIIVVAIAIAAGLYIYNAQKPRPTPTVETPAQTRVNDAKVAADSKIYSNNGNIEAGIAIYDDAIKNAQTNDEKANLYLQKSSLAFKNNQTDAAIEAAELGIALSSGNNDALYFAAASAYEQKKDYTKALEDYTKARDIYLKANNNMKTATVVYYQKKIDSLKGKM